ncbi:TM2 domain-containing protein CG10795-like protein [Dinothrombium tinctorium]|uniref:TM2 domain-containing protein CG10795-like protein n=1 Tax=Dinothrombium tinctorium TaxID=1965070 RepID=A0A3S3PRJ2_9ACAR|nr:TM2 domain-containing protein CG10795-like protein [Dinothrombium tinctorium]
MGQYSCPKLVIDPITEQPINCGRNNRALINCTLNEGIVCEDDPNRNTFIKEIPCLYTNGYYFETSLLLSIFLGMFGFDRFYLGYPGIGLLKFCTLGCLFVGQLIDIILIALQIVGPSDGSNYVIKYFGPRLTLLNADNDSLIVLQTDS